MNLSRARGRRYAAWPLAVGLAAAVAACGGGDDNDDPGDGGTPDALAVYRDQVVAWSACDDSILGGGASRDLMHSLGDRLTCAYVRAPLDWAAPARGDVAVAVMRLSTADAKQRQGSILLNPGGPGEDGLAAWHFLNRAFSHSNPESPAGAQQLKLMASYDLIGFSPRGLGASTRVFCATNEQERPVDQSTTEGQSDTSLANAHYNAAKLAEACQRNPVVPYINTDATARDMDLIRGLLGDAKLNYVGYSYGTWLGAWYASLFPEKVGRMVLDSALDFVPNGMEKALVAKVVARQTIQDDILAPYAARHADYFRLGTTDAEVRAVFTALSPRMQGLVGSQLAGNSYRSDKTDDSLEYVMAARTLDALLSRVDPSDEDAVEAALEAHPFVPDDEARDLSVRTKAIELYEWYAQAWVSPTTSRVGTDGAFWPITCNDSVFTTDAASWTATVRAQAALGPLYYDFLKSNTCVYWGGPRVTQPDVAAAKALDILLVQSEFDSATPTPDADRLFARLPGAHRVYVPGEYGHGVFPYVDSCVDPIVVGYLLGEKPAQRQANCPAHPLKQDAEAAKQAGSSKAGTASSPASAPTYTDPEEARRWIQRFKDGLTPRSGPR
ncbi:MAG: alpha/beta fold hydrolase [Ottowia sp.]|nr:alpha/beta fold hydrolase [Ottowia sp.]